MLQITNRGLYCSPGDFFIDPWLPVERAILTHAHADHARPGSHRYLAAEDGQHLLTARLGNNIALEPVPYGQNVLHNGVCISFHPAGHVLGSAQVRLEYRGEVVVVTGDYKLNRDPTCRAFEPVRCHTFVTESTFGLPVYRWEEPGRVFDQINHWWRANRDQGRASVIFAYSLGKAQRLLAGVDHEIGPIFTHGAVERVNQAYRNSGIALPQTSSVGDVPRGHKWGGALIVAPPSADGTSWARKFEPASRAMASGWMQLRGTRRRRGVDRGFVLSDHADWPGLIEAIQQSEATEILVTHGSAAILARWLTERGKNADVLHTRFEGEVEDADAPAEVPA